MWIASKYGFYSIVAAHTDERGTPHPTLMMIRARARGHLEALQEHMPDLDLGPLQENTGTDYPYRFVVDRNTTMAAIAALSEGIDYTNFKNAVAKGQVYDGQYIDFLMDTWSNGLHMEDTALNGEEE